MNDSFGQFGSSSIPVATLHLYSLSDLLEVALAHSFSARSVTLAADWLHVSLRVS